MADDQTNPFTVAGMAAMMQPNKYTDPSLQGKPLQLQGYRGTPTDAMGRPIQSFLDAQTQHDAWDAAHPAPAQGTTLNSAPAGLEAQGSQARAMQDAGYGDWAMLDPMVWRQTNRPDYSATRWGRERRGDRSKLEPLRTQTRSAYPTSRDRLEPQRMMPRRGASGAGGSGSAGANPVDMRQAYLDALSNPGKVTTPGATVPQAAPLGQPSVLNSFLAAHPGGGGGPAAGNYTNKPFFDTLNQLRSA